METVAAASLRRLPPGSGNQLITMSNKVLIIVIDGCRPDGIETADTPVIDHLVATGAHTFAAQTVSPSITLPAHFSIFTGRTPLNHGVLVNSGRPGVSPDTVSLFELARYHGRTSAAFYSWEHLRNLAPPGVLAESHLIDTVADPEGDLIIAELAGRRIAAARFDLSFVYLEGVDKAGHEHGWMSASFIEAITIADRAIGRLRDTLATEGVLSDYTTLLLADHGGSGSHHQQPTPEVLTVPFIAHGERITPGFTISRPVSVIDLAPTAAHLMNITPHWLWEGNAITEMLRS